MDLEGEGELPAAIKYPYPFASSAGEDLVIPMNEGISYPVDDASIEPMRLIAYGGHGICMGFWGVTDGRRGYMCIIESPDDAIIHIDRLGRQLRSAPEWESQKGQFGYARRLRYVFLTTEGMWRCASATGNYAQQIGLVRPSQRNAAANPNVDLLIGAVNVWCWDRDAVPLVKEMKAAGIDRILWSNRQPPEGIRGHERVGSPDQPL